MEGGLGKSQNKLRVTTRADVINMTIWVILVQYRVHANGALPMYLLFRCTSNGTLFPSGRRPFQSLSNVSRDPKPSLIRVYFPIPMALLVPVH